MRGGLRRVSELLPAGPGQPPPSAVSKRLLPLRCSALGVQLMRFVFLMKLELQDATDSLGVFLWRDAVSCGRPPFEPSVVVALTVGVVCSRQELFFGVTAEDAAANQESQSRVCRTLESLCPPEGSTGTFLLNTPDLHLLPLRLRPHARLSRPPCLWLCPSPVFPCPQVSVRGSTCVWCPTGRRTMSAGPKPVIRSATAPSPRPADAPRLLPLLTFGLSVFLFILRPPAYLCKVLNAPTELCSAANRKK